jgi:peptidoglycan-associated lipoprotein
MSKIPQAAHVVQIFPTVHFEFDSAKLSKEDITLIYNEASKMKNKKNSETLVIGACDERGSVEYNMKLGLRRAKSVQTELERFGVLRRQIRIQSIGKSNPIATGHDEYSWAQNRRAEMRTDTQESKSPMARR